MVIGIIPLPPPTHTETNPPSFFGFVDFYLGSRGRSPYPPQKIARKHGARGIYDLRNRFFLSQKNGFGEFQLLFFFSFFSGGFQNIPVGLFSNVAWARFVLNSVDSHCFFSKKIFNQTICASKQVVQKRGCS